MEYFDIADGIGPEALGLLRDVLSEICRQRDIDPKSVEGNALAASLIDLYHCGFRTRQELTHMVARHLS